MISELAASGTRPRSTNGMTKRLPSSARTKSQWNSMVVPMPTALPWTAATIGTWFFASARSSRQTGISSPDPGSGMA